MSMLTNEFLHQLGNGAVDMLNDSIVAVLLLATYTQDKDHDGYTDVSTYEVSGTGYVAKNKALGTKAWAKDDSGDFAWFNSADLQWSGATLTGVTRVALIDTTVSDLLIGVWDIPEAPLEPVAGNLDITVNVNGWFRSFQA